MNNEKSPEAELSDKWNSYSAGFCSGMDAVETVDIVIMPDIPEVSNDFCFKVLFGSVEVIMLERFIPHSAGKCSYFEMPVSLNEPIER